MRGALGTGPLRKLHQNYYLATTTAMTVVLYEEGEPIARQTGPAAAAVA
jgi:protocatechuate 4,5-dioxygenase beta chain